MSEAKEKYFIADFNEGEIFEYETLEQVLEEITLWFKDVEGTEEDLNKGDIAVIKGVKVKIEIEKKAIQG